ncbi:Acyl transferase/acyl hydrolase/lysophospholipase [Syntrophomonas zehnderi OL-4]|uniref:Acyl transferase/acyl hydrolase/lysophospholipase n=1 Tax=Syntrophomonas zehnderi OL-4 TaxID=690567 RepID=A0A0E4C9L7_9FIRM|nr:patatin-like phospholipase family protein [Syntrophomonas zehnderi]CFY04960.1 Acyl transferase/acyl hydrolase/lysophospholipase [Syntrophomonas zehnderi OL-4]
MLEQDKPVVALVLGAGSARGLAHIGVLQVLAEEKIPLDFIVGSSMGAMVGAIYGSGADIYLLDKMAEYLNTSSMLDVQVPHYGFIAGKRINAFLQLLTKNKNFDQLNPPVLVVATDLISGERIVFDEGPVAEAVRASISIPGVFTPVRKEQMVLVDGAVIDRLPVEVAQSRGADIVIAVDVTFGPGRKVAINNTLDVILTSLDIMQKYHFDMIGCQADILIQPAVGQYASQDFEYAREIIDLGRKAALDKIASIQELLKERKG